MKYVSLSEILAAHQEIIDATGGSHGIRDLGAVESALAQPQMTFAGEDLYPTLAEKAAALGFSLVKNHAFVDGNKRIGHAAMESFLVMNGHEIACALQEAEEVILSLAASEMSREKFAEWVADHIRPIDETHA